MGAARIFLDLGIDEVSKRCKDLFRTEHTEMKTHGVNGKIFESRVWHLECNEIPPYEIRKRDGILHRKSEIVNPMLRLRSVRIKNHQSKIVNPKSKILTIFPEASLG